MPASPESSTDLTFAALCLRPASQQQLAFLLAPDERRQCRRVERFEAAFRGTRAQRRPDPRWLLDTFEIFLPEVLQIEEIAEKTARAVGDDDSARLGDPL